MGHTARLHAKQKFCANDVIPQYEAVLSAGFGIGGGGHGLRV